MRINEAALAAELAHAHGTTTRSRLRRIGLSDRQIDCLLASGRLVSAGFGVLRSPTVPSSLEQQAAIACARTYGAISFPTAGRIWQLRKTPHLPEIHVVVPWERRLQAPPGVRVHRSRKLPPSDLVCRPDGITVTSPPRTVFDAAGFLGADELESLIEDALYRRLFTPATLSAVVERLGHPCRDGSPLIGRVLADRNPLARAVASDYELRLERALRERGFPGLVRQHALELAPGRWIHPDLGLPADRFYIEVDHRRWHDTTEQGAYDRWRDRQMRLLGLWVERVSDRAIDHRLAETVDDLWSAWQRARGLAVTRTVA